MRVVKISLSVFFCLHFLLITSNVKAEEKGNDTLVSIEPFFSFPAVPFIFPNQALTFGFFRSGFGLEDSSTTCTFKSVFPVSGSIYLNGGQLYLANDLIMQDFASFNSSGIILGNNHTMEFSSSVTGIPAVYNTVFQNTSVFLNSDFSIAGTVRFKGTCLVDGRWNKISLGNNTSIQVDRNSTLYLRNIAIDGVARSNIRCLNNDSTIILDNMSWEQDADFTFSTGSILFDHEVNIWGNSNFNYTSALSSTIASHATLFINYGMTFSYAPQVGNKNLLHMADNTSQLYLNGCTVVSTRTGLQLSTGILTFDNKVTLSSQARFGSESLSLKSDLDIRMLGGSFVDLHGIITYDA